MVWLLAEIAKKDEVIGQLQDALQNLKIMKEAEIELKNEQLNAVIKSSRKVIATRDIFIEEMQRMISFLIAFVPDLTERNKYYDWLSERRKDGR